MSFARKLARKQMRKAMKEEETQEEETGEEAAEDAELTQEEAESMIIDAECFLRAGAEKLDILVDAGVLDASLRDKIDEVCTALSAKIEEM